MSPVEVITLAERRRRWSAAQKRAMVEEAVKDAIEIAREKN